VSSSRLPRGERGRLLGIAPVTTPSRTLEVGQIFTIVGQKERPSLDRLEAPILPLILQGVERVATVVGFGNAVAY